jgi:hypothetical protein
MRFKQDTIIKLYPTVFNTKVTKEGVWSAYDKDGKEVSIDINAVNTEYAKEDYIDKREDQYPSLEEQLDLQYWDQVNGTTKWKEAIAKVKSDNPKP